MERYPVIGVIISAAAFWVVSKEIGLRGTLFERLTRHSDGGALPVRAGRFRPPPSGCVRAAGSGRRPAGAWNRFLLWLGVISYGLYLWHLTIFNKLHGGSFISTVQRDLGLPLWLTWLLVGVGFSIAVSALSYYAVERSALMLKRVAPRDAVAAAGAAFGRLAPIGAALCAVLMFAGAALGTGYLDARHRLRLGRRRRAAVPRCAVP